VCILFILYCVAFANTSPGGVLVAVSCVVCYSPGGMLVAVSCVVCYSPGGVLVAVSCVVCYSPGGVLVAADYSQLELRVIAHLSADRKLLGILNAGGDVFKLIASQWKMVDTADVSTEHRQQAKQVFLLSFS